MIYLRIKENTPQAKAVIDLLKTMDFVEFVSTKTAKELTLEAITEAKSGKITKSKNVKEMFKKLNS